MVQLHKLYTTEKMSEVLINKQKFFFDSLTLIIYSNIYIELLHLSQKCNNEKEIVSALINKIKTKPNQNPNLSLRKSIRNLVVKKKNLFCVLYLQSTFTPMNLLDFINQ